MNRRQAIGALSVTQTLWAAPAARDRFLGVWKLLSCRREWPGGRVEYPYGEKPVGRITYDSAGRMSAQLMRPGRRSTVPSGVSLIAGKAGAEEIREAVDGYIAYYGAFDVDESTQTVIHHVEACLIASWVGTDLKRTYRFQGDKLILRAVSDSVLELVWQREAR